jgi:hypothetical protein
VVAKAREAHRIKADVAIHARRVAEDAGSYWYVASDRLREVSMRAGLRSVLLGLWSTWGGKYHDYVREQKANANTNV